MQAGLVRYPFHERRSYNLHALYNETWADFGLDQLPDESYHE
jgi:hypothetical protein